MEINLLDMETMQTIVTELEASEDRERKRESYETWEVYSGNLQNYVKQELRRTRPKAFESYTISSVSLSKIITDKMAKAYKEQPTRALKNESPVKDERYQEIQDQADFKRQLRFLDTVTNLQKYSLAWLHYREEDQEYQLMALQPHEFSVIRNKDTGKLQAVILNYGNRDITSGSDLGDGISGLLAESQADSSAQSEIYAMWTDTQHVVVKVEHNETLDEMGRQVIKKDITYVPINGNDNNENKLGMLPFVFVSKETSADYPIPSNLKEHDITFNTMMSEAMTSSNIQGSGVLTLSYPEEQEGMFKNLSTGLTSAIKLPQMRDADTQTTAQYISPSPNLEGQLSVLSAYSKMVLKEKGINAGSAVGNDMESFSSGLERAIANADIQDQVMIMQDLYTKVEKKLFEIIKAWEFLIGRNTFSVEDEIEVIFPKPRVLISDKEVLENIETRLRLGLIEKHEALMILDPNLSEDEAREKIESMDNSTTERMRSVFGNQETNQVRPERDQEQSPS